MKHIPVALLGGIVYFVDKNGHLCSLRKEGVATECDEPMEPVALCAGIGGCGNHRIFIADAKDKSLKVFDPINRRLDLLVKLPSTPLGLSKEECRLAISVEEGILEFDLKTLEVTGVTSV